MSRKYYVYLVFFFVVIKAFPQKAAADRHYARAEYFRAIPKYKKSIQTNDTQSRKESLINLAHCYRILNEYAPAADYYKAAIILGDVPADTYYYYGMVLKSLQRYNEALSNFKLYIEKQPQDDKAGNAYKSSKEIHSLQTKPQEYRLTNLQSLNTKGSEFCAFEIENGIVYTGEKQSDFVEYSKSDFNGQPFLTVMQASYTSEGFGKPKLYSKKVNTSYHDGPLCFSADAKTLYLTRVTYVNKWDKDFSNYAKLFTFTKAGNTWSKAVPFPYNSDTYSCAHASISADGSSLFFSSDMPGGFGGKDLWMCKKNGESWDKPVNLGSKINTSGDEMFPYIRKDSTLFFSSNGLPGFGGLDIFSANYVRSEWVMKRNEGVNLNSSADDFGITFLTDSTGYVSSNREGGKGKDDLYKFTYRNKHVRIEGNILLTKNSADPAKNVSVFLLSPDLKRIDSTKTDEKGYFLFDNLDVDKVYLAEVENDDVKFKNKSRYYLSDKNGQLVRVTHKQNKMNFVFRNLPVEGSPLPDLYSDDEGDVNIAGNIVFGSNPTKPVTGKKIVITNIFNDIIEETTTDALGAFAFRNLDPGQDYLLTVDGEQLPEGVKIILTSKKGKEVKALISNGTNKYKFQLLAADKSTLEELIVQDQELIMVLIGSVYDQNKKPLASANIVIFEKDKVIQSIITDSKGRFHFRNLSPGKDYVFSLNDSDQIFSHVSRIYIGDSNGKIYKQVLRSKNKYEFRLLDVDKSALGEFSVDDPWLEVINMKNNGGHAGMTIIEKVTYVTGGYSLDETGTHILDKIISVLKADHTLKIELSSHTDSQGSDSYNLDLSKKRAKAAVDYLIAKGISKDRLKAIGYGETRLLNKCDNDAKCPDEEHALNRRTEFKILESFNPHK